MKRMYRAATIVATCGCLFLTAPPAAAQDADPAHDESPAQAASQEDQETPPPKPAHPLIHQRIGRAPDDISSEILQMKGKIEGLFKATPFKHAWVNMNDELDAAVGLRLGLAYTALYQKATWAVGPDEAGSGIFEFSGNWHLVGTPETDPGRLAFRAEGKHAYTTLTPNQLGLSIGSLWGTADSFGADDFALTQLWWEQFLFHNHLAFRVGKIKQKDVVNTGRFRSAKFFFLNDAFSGNPTLPYPDEGLGVGIDLIPTDLFYVAGVISDASASSTSSGFNTLFQVAEFFASLELGLTPHFPNRGDGHYRLTVWHQEGREDAGTSSGNGISLSFDQELGNGLVPFLRYGYTDSGLTPTRQYLAGGFGIPTPFGRKNDTFGVGVAWGEPEDSSLRDQYVAEIFYRIQVTPSLSLTPSVQMIFDPSISLDEDVVAVFSMRARVAF